MTEIPSNAISIRFLFWPIGRRCVMYVAVFLKYVVGGGAPSYFYEITVSDILDIWSLLQKMFVANLHGWKKWSLRIILFQKRRTRDLLWSKENVLANHLGPRKTVFVTHLIESKWSLRYLGSKKRSLWNEFINIGSINRSNFMTFL